MGEIETAIMKHTPSLALCPKVEITGVCRFDHNIDLERQYLHE